MLQMSTDNSGSSYSLPGATRDELSQTIRSFRDTLSISLQNLNLTLASMTHAVRNMQQGAVGVANFMNPQANRIAANNNGIYAGGLSQQMQGFLSNASTFDLMSSQRPYNVDPMEFYTQRNMHRTNALASLGVNTGLTAASLGISGFAGMGMANRMAKLPLIGRIPKFGLGLVGMGIAGAVLDPIVGRIGDEAQAYMNDTTAIKRMSTKFGSEFTFGQAGRVSSGIRNLAYNESMQSTGYDSVLGLDGHRNMLMKGLQNNLFHGDTPEQLKKQLEEGAKVVKLLTGVLGSKDINETMDSIAKLKGMGVNLMNNPKMALGMSANAMKYGATMGMSGQALMGMAAMSAQSTYGAMGLPAFGGMNPFMRNMALAHEMEKRNMLSSAEVAGAGGHQGIANNMNAALAAMMKSPQLGDVMLASGGRGNGYFGMLGNATQNIVGDPYKMAAFMNNKTNSWAKMMENGKASSGMMDTLKKAVYQMPFMQGNVSHDKQFNMAQAHIRQILQSMGAPADDATVKMFATQIVYPNRMASLDQEANRQYDRGTRDMLRDKMGVFRGFERIGEGFGRVGSSIDYAFQRAGSFLGKMGLNMFEDDYNPLQISGGAPISDLRTMSNVRELSSLKNKSFNRLSGSQVTAARNIAGLDYAGIDDYGDNTINVPLLGKIRPNRSFIANALNGGRGLAPGYLAEKTRQMGWYYNDEDMGLGAQAYAMKGMGKELGEYRKGFDKFQSKMGVGNWFDAKNATVNAGVAYAYKTMMGSGKYNLENSRSAFKEKYKGLGDKVNVSDEVLSMLQDGGLSNADLRMRLTNNESIRSQGKLADVDRVVAAVMEKYNRGGLVGDASDIMAYGNDQERATLRFGANAVRDKDNFQADGKRLMLGNLNMNNPNAGKAAKEMGLDDGVLERLTSNASMSQIKAAGSVLDKWMSGESYTDELGNIGNRDLEEFVKSQLGRDKGSVRDNYLAMGVGSVSEGLNSLVGLKARARGEATYSSVFGESKGKDIFGKIANDDTDGALASILGANPNGDAHAKDMQSFARRAMGSKGDKDKLLSLLGEQIGQENLGQFNGKSADELMKVALDAAMTNTGVSKDAADQAKDLEDRDIRKTVTKGSKGEYALRVVVDNQFQPSEAEVAKMRNDEKRAGSLNVTDGPMKSEKTPESPYVNKPGGFKNPAASAVGNAVDGFFNSVASVFKSSSAAPSTWNSFFGS